MASYRLLIILITCLVFITPISFVILSLIYVPCHFYYPIHQPCTSLPAHHIFIHSVVSDLSFQEGARTSSILMHAFSYFHWILHNNTTSHNHKACGIITILDNGNYVYKASLDRAIITICCSIS